MVIISSYEDYKSKIQISTNSTSYKNNQQNNQSNLNSLINKEQNIDHEVNVNINNSFDKDNQNKSLYDDNSNEIIKAAIEIRNSIRNDKASIVNINDLIEEIISISQINIKLKNCIQSVILKINLVEKIKNLLIKYTNILYDDTTIEKTFIKLEFYYNINNYNMLDLTQYYNLFTPNYEITYNPEILFYLIDDNDINKLFTELNLDISNADKTILTDFLQKIKKVVIRNEESKSIQNLQQDIIKIKSQIKNYNIFKFENTKSELDIIIKNKNDFFKKFEILGEDFKIINYNTLDNVYKNFITEYIKHDLSNIIFKTTYKKDFTDTNDLNENSKSKIYLQIILNGTQNYTYNLKINQIIGNEYKFDNEEKDNKTYFDDNERLELSYFTNGHHNILENINCNLIEILTVSGILIETNNKKMNNIFREIKKKIK